MSVRPDGVASWLTPRRLRAQAIILALCTWAICAADLATPGLLDRAGNIKFQDFLPVYVAARLIAQGRAGEIYDQQIIATEAQAIVPHPAVSLPYLYGPQLGLIFVPLTRLSFPVSAAIWVTLGLLIYFCCVFLIWKSNQGAPLLPVFARSGTHDRLSHNDRVLLISAAVAFPPLFHFFIRGQTSALVLACFAAAFFVFRADHRLAAGLVLGCLFLKPQFLLALPLVLLLAGAWKELVGIVLSVGAQLAFIWIYFGGTITRAYLDLFFHASRWLSSAEPGIAAIQMHSLRAFWSLLIPWPQAAFVLYVASSIASVFLAANIWKSSSPLATRFSALILAAVLVNPHLFVYDLLAMAPVFLLLAGNARTRPNSAIRLLLYLSFMLPLLGPLSRWTHVQFSVVAFFVLLWLLVRDTTTGHKLASHESRVV